MFKIGMIKLDNNLVLAPMAGITNLPFRIICKEHGAGLVFTEMVSAMALVRNSKKTRELLRSDPSERPLVVQLFGSESRIMAEAARLVEGEGADILDINMGCPARKIVSTGAGSALLKDPAGISMIISEVRRAVNIPLTVKIRSGWDSGAINFFEVGRIAEECGADAVTLHPRTTAQAFGGRSNWSHIAGLKSSLSIPVIGNGDVKGPEDAKRMLDETGCDGVMIGRAALGNPWIFRRTLEYMNTGVVPDVPLTEEIFETIKMHLHGLAELMGKRWAVRDFRKHLAWYTRGLPYSSDFRKEAVHIEDFEELISRCEEYLGTLKLEEDETLMQAFKDVNHEIGAQ